MNSLLFYIISTGVCLSLFILTYLLFLKNNTRFNLCRFYLIAAILFSFIIPFITIDVGFSFISKNETITNTAKPIIADKIEVQELESIPVQIETSNWSIDYKQTASIIFISIALLLFVRFIFRFGSIILIQTSGNRFENEDGTNLIFTDRTDNAFSFLGSIFINPLKFTDEEKRLIIEHEREHIRHLHSIDLILIELLIVLQWFNPFAYIARRKLIEIHEFIADNGVIQKGADPYSYQNLLLSVVSSSCLPTVGNQLSALITKKRIAMIGKPLNQTGRWINFLVLIPISILLIIGVSAFTYEKPKGTNNYPENEMKLNTEPQTKKEELLKRAEAENEYTYLKDLYYQLKPINSPNESNSYSYSIVLKKKTLYKIYFLSGSKEDNLLTSINLGSGEEFSIENQFTFSNNLSRTFEPKETGAYHIKITNLSSKNAEALVLLSLIGESKDNSNQVNGLNIQKRVENKFTQAETSDTFLVVEQMPTFGNGNEDEFPKWIAANMQYPKEAIEKGVYGKVYVEFLVSKDGSLKNPRIRKGIDPLLDAEALRLVNSCPKWNPGKQRGMAVDVKVTQPINFSAIEIKKNAQSQEIQETDEQVFKSLIKRAQNEIKDTWLKDFTIDLAPNSSQSYSIILKKGCVYNIFLLSENENEKLGMKVVFNKSETEKETVADNVFKYPQISLLPTKTGSFTIITSNPTETNKKALLVVTLKEVKEKLENISNNQNLQGTPENNDEAFTVVEQMPVFGNGIAGEFQTWLKSNIQYPKLAKENAIQAKVFVQFVIEKDGSLTNAKVLRGVDPELDKEALRVVLSSPKWKPGMQRGVPVRVLYTTPVNFALN